MKEGTSPVIQAAELLEIGQIKELVLVDASNGKNAKINYQEKHLAGALFVDLNTQLADIKDDLSKGGRHPLPTVEQFSKVLSSLGISKQSHVIIYDDKSASNAAARFWWMLKSIGHASVQVLNGGLQQAEKAGYPLSQGIEEPVLSEPYEIQRWQLPLADMFEVERAVQNKDTTVIDVRDRERFNGEIEPIDLVAGHIPGAINIPFSMNLDNNGLFLPPTELKKMYQETLNKTQAENIIVHCGSGVTACHTLLAMAYSGLEIPKLYVGSWSEWSRNNKPMVTKYDLKV